MIKIVGLQECLVIMLVERESLTQDVRKPTLPSMEEHSTDSAAAALSGSASSQSESSDFRAARCLTRPDTRKTGSTCQRRKARGTRATRVARTTIAARSLIVWWQAHRRQRLDQYGTEYVHLHQYRGLQRRPQPQPSQQYQRWRWLRRNGQTHHPSGAARRRQRR